MDIRQPSPFSYDKRPLLMGVLNVTPDSFSDGGNFLDPDLAIRHALRLLNEGADIIDVGGESTRPPSDAYGEGSVEVDAEVECDRVLPVISAVMAARPDALISIDTVKPVVARLALAAGARIINDVSAGRYDSAMMEIAAESDATYILMHGHDPRNRMTIDQVWYRDVVEDVYTFLEQRIQRARSFGIREIIADVGIGFAKGAADNIRLLREHARFSGLGVPMLVGVSRKAFIGKLLGDQPLERRLYGTLAANMAAVQNGASILRVHDVLPAREFFTVYNSILSQHSSIDD